MVNRNNSTLFIITILLTNSCVWKQSFDFDSALRNKFPQPTNNGNTFNDTGFFIQSSKDNLRFFTTLVFYPDGIFLFDINQKDSTQLKHYFQNAENKNRIMKSWKSGYYHIINDTVFMYYPKPPGGMTHFTTLSKYKINNPNQMSYLGAETSFGETMRPDIPSEPNSFVFVKVHYLPSYNSWLKQKRWFWADKNAYRNYKKEMKKRNNTDLENPQ